MKPLLLLLLLPVFSRAQSLINGRPFPQQQVNEAIQKAWEEKNRGPALSGTNNVASGVPLSGVYHFLQTQEPGAKEILVKRVYPLRFAGDSNPEKFYEFFEQFNAAMAGHCAVAPMKRTSWRGSRCIYLAE